MLVQVCRLARTCAACVVIGCVMVFSDDGAICLNATSAATVPFKNLAYKLEECAYQKPVYISEFLFNYIVGSGLFELMLIAIAVALKRIWGSIAKDYIYWHLRFVHPAFHPHPDEAPPQENQLPQPAPEQPEPIEPEPFEPEPFEPEPIEPPAAPEPAPPVQHRRRRKGEVEWLRENLLDDLQFRDALE